MRKDVWVVGLLFFMGMLGLGGMQAATAKEQNAKASAYHVEKIASGEYKVSVSLGKFNPDDVTLYLLEKNNATLIPIEDIIIFDEKRPNELQLKVAAKDFQKYKETGSIFEIIHRVGEGPLDFTKTRVLFSKAKVGSNNE